MSMQLPEDFNGADYVTVAEARAMLGKSKAAMSAMIARGFFKTLVPSPLDGRVKLIKREEVQRLVPLTKRGRAGGPSSSLVIAGL